MKKIIVAHPFRQHSFRLATALQKSGNLYAYCTTVYDKKGSFMDVVKKMIKGDDLKKANGRKCEGFPDEKVKLFCELRGYFALLMNRKCPSVRLKNAYQRYFFDSFGKKVARYAERENVDAIIMFDTTATECFKYLKKYCPNIELIIDMSAATQKYCKKIYEDEEKKTGITAFRERQPNLWNNKALSHSSEELILADRFICASDFTRRSLLYCGVDGEKINIVKYGVDFAKFNENQHPFNETQKLKLVYVGHVDYRKGVHHLLSTVKRFDPSQVELHMYGVFHKDTELYKEFGGKSNIFFHGFVTPDKLCDIYNNCDLFVFPSTNDGYGLVVLEALACGTPVLCSKNAGAADLIQENVNGFTFNSGDEERLYEIIAKCIQNRHGLIEMKKNCRKAVESCTWEAYDEQISCLFSRE